jgi:hypothetical protein
VGADRRRWASAVPAALMTGVALVLLVGCGDGGAGDATRRQEEVAERGAEVMPFDLEATTHQFEPVADGLVQTVVADDPTDREQVGLVQDHLTQEAERFRSGDYRDPAAIHGDSMPGLRELEAGAGAIIIAYERRDDGARLTFRSDDPALVDALHRWGEAQVMDHGRHARPSSRSLRSWEAP